MHTHRGRSTTASEVPGTRLGDSGPIELSVTERAILVDLARRALSAATDATSDEQIAPPPEATASLLSPAAVFVTLTIEGELRGCVGSLVADCPLWESVVRSAVSAALYDPRFRPLERDELPDVHLEISVLGRRTPFEGVAAFRPGVDGVIVERAWRRALLLPEVAPEFGWGAEEMLEAVCRKAGLPAGAWHERGTAVYTFRTIRFGGDARPEA